jgi:hypothetical protein
MSVIFQLLPVITRTHREAIATTATARNECMLASIQVICKILLSLDSFPRSCSRKIA